MTEAPHPVTLVSTDFGPLVSCEFTATVQHTYDSSVQLTRHPIETGASIADHIILTPRKVTFDIWLNDITEESPNPKLFVDGPRVSKATALYADLLKAQEQGGRFFIDTELLSPEAPQVSTQALLSTNEYVITQITAERTSKTGHAVHIRSLTLEQVRSVSNSTSKLPKTRKTTGANKKTAAQAKAARISAAEEQKGTIVHDLAHVGIDLLSAINTETD